MFLNKLITKSTGDYSDNIKQLKEEIKTSDAVLIGAGAGLSASAGLTYSGERFYRYFSDFHEKYGINDIYSGGFYPYETLEEYWAWWSRHIWVNRYMDIPKPVYNNLLEIIKDKDYFVLTTNVDHCFQKSGFDKQKIFYTQGDYGLFQCSEPCCQKTYDNKKAVREMILSQKNMKIPTELIPKCPVCGAPMTVNLRSDITFVQDNGWYEALDRYKDFLRKYENVHILYLELGVGSNTPTIIKYPFWQMTIKNPKSIYACINQGEAFCPSETENRSICINADIGNVINELNYLKKYKSA